jgi:hypothetical protein
VHFIAGDGILNSKPNGVVNVIEGGSERHYYKSFDTHTRWLIASFSKAVSGRASQEKRLRPDFRGIY